MLSEVYLEEKRVMSLLVVFQQMYFTNYLAAYPEDAA